MCDSIGREFVAGGYDRTVRIFKANEGHSREVVLAFVVTLCDRLIYEDCLMIVASLAGISYKTDAKGEYNKVHSRFEICLIWLRRYADQAMEGTTPQQSTIPTH